MLQFVTMNRVIVITMAYLTYILAHPSMDFRVVTVERTSNVNKDVQEFINLLPSDKITLLVRDYITNDVEVRKTVDYFHSKPVEEQIMNIASSPEYHKVLRHLESSGLDISSFMVQLHNFLGRVPPSAPVTRAGLGLRGLLLDSIKPLIPVSQLKLLATQKYIFSSEFRGLVRIITSKPFKDDINALVTSKHVKILENDAKVVGVDVEAIYEFIASFKFLYDYLMNL